MTHKFFLPFGLVFLAILIGLPTTRSASSHAFPAASILQDVAKPVTDLPDPWLANSSPTHRETQPPYSSTKPNLRFDCLTATDGLSFSLVTSILQDQRGFMWFGTRYGLDKYNGNNISVYLPGPSNDLMGGNYILNLNQDKNGDLWLATSIDLVHWDVQSGEFIHYQPDPANPESLTPDRINAFGRDAEGALLIGTNTGLNRYNPATDTFSRYLIDQPVFEIYADRLGGIWLGTMEGVVYYSSGSLGQPDPVRYQVDRSNPQRPSSNLVTAIYEDRQGDLWVGTDGGGLNRLDRAAGKYIPYPSTANQPLSAGAPPVLGNGRVWSMLEDGSGRLWMGTQNGLYLLDPTTGNIYQYHSIPGDAHSLINNTVTDLYQDRSGVVWMATIGGICRLNETASHFTHYQESPSQAELAAGAQPGSTALLSDDTILSVYQDSHGIFWIGTINGGLNRLDRSTGKVTVYQHDPADPTSLSPGDVSAIYEDAAGTLWIGTSTGLNRFNAESESFESQEALFWVSIGAIVGDPQGNLWVGTFEGLYRREPGTTAFTPRALSSDPPAGSRINRLHLDHGGALWIASQDNGLFRLDRAAEGGSNSRLVHFPQKPNDPSSPGISPVMDIFEDTDGTLWLGTVSDGLVRYDRDTQTFIHYLPNPRTARDDALSHYVSCIEKDAQGNLWMGTALGLARFDPRSEKFAYFDALDGLMVGEGISCAQSKDGEMFFGSWQGLNSFFPGQIRGNPNPPAVVITALNLRDKVLRSDLKPDEQVRLPYHENYLSFDFAALDYAAPAKNQYAYKMEGLDADWVMAGTRNHADYPDLRPGAYTFRVRASNNSGVWNEQGVAVKITITPPFWQTWWFMGLVGVLLAGIVIGGVRMRLKSVEARSRELEAQVASRTADLVTSVAQLTALQNTAKAVASTLEQNSLLNLIIQQATTLLQADGGFINLVDWDRRVDEVVAVAGIAPPVVGERISLEASLSGWVTLHNQATISNDIQKDDRVARSVRSWVIEEHIQSAVAAPMIVRDQVKGTLLVIAREERKGKFVQADLDLLVAFANQAAIAIENARLYEQSKEFAVDEEHRRQELEALLSADERMQRYLHQDQVLQALVDVAVDILRADKSSVFWWDKKKEKLVTRVSRGFDPQGIQQLQFLRGEGIVGRVTMHGETVLVEDTFTDPNRSLENPLNVKFALDEGVRSFMFFPIIIRDEILGAFNVSFLKPHAAGEEEQRLFQALTQRAALQVENARLYEQSKELAVLEERSRLARELHDAVTQTLFSASLVAEALPATWEKDPQEGRGLLQELRGLSRGALAEMRSLLLELRPTALVETSLGDLLRQLGEAASGRGGIPVSVKVDGQAKLPQDVQIAFYRVAQEALNNIVKHARARKVDVKLSYASASEDSAPAQLKVLLTICDDGRGFDPTQVPHNRLGIGIMQERVQAIGADLSIHSQPGRGTEVTMLWEQRGKEEI